MPKRLSKNEDVNQLAHQLVQLATKKSEPSTPSKAAISQVMAEMGRKGGKKGGKRRMETLTPEERREIASKAAKARWAKRKNSDEAKPR